MKDASFNMEVFYKNFTIANLYYYLYIYYYVELYLRVYKRYTLKNLLLGR